MSFSPRQLHCLDAMGFVAWTNRSTGHAVVSEQPTAPHTVEELPIADAISAQPPVGSIKSSTTTTGPASNNIVANAAMPSAINQLAQWLVRQPLAQLNYKGRQASYIGSDQAALLVVCVQAAESSSLPLSRESTQLFDLMMRAIEMPRTGFRQCALPTVASAHASDTSQTVYIDDIFTPQTRAVLVLDPNDASASESSNAHTVLLPSSSLPLWRVPHPDLLLRVPALKRQAWEELKGLRRVLDDHG